MGENVGRDTSDPEEERSELGHGSWSSEQDRDEDVEDDMARRLVGGN